MKWRVTFGDPREPDQNIRNGATFEIAAGNPAESGWKHPDLMSAATAIELARQDIRSENVAWVLLKAELVGDQDRIIHWEIPYPIAKLNFDPATIEDPKFQQIWADPLARTIWLAVKYCHMTNQHFDAECLVATKNIRERNPRTVAELQTAMRMAMRRNTINLNEPFWEQLLPCVLGTRQIGFEVALDPVPATSD